MEDKTFEFLEKMYSDITKRLDYIESGQNELKAGQQQVTQRLKKIETTLEHDIKSNLQALHERAMGNTVKLDEHTSQLTDINNKLDYLALSVNSQDKRLEVVETFKRKSVK